MANVKKTVKKADAVIVVTPAENNPETPISEHIEIETPAELVPVMDEFKPLVGHQKAQMHLVSFAPFLKEISDLESGITLIGDEDADKAKELRLKYAKIRTGAASTKADGKRDLLAETRMIDGLYNAIAGACELKENYLKNIETAKITREENERKELKASRKATLDALDYDTEFLTLEDMPEESFNRLVQKATDIKHGTDLVAQQRKANEEKEQRDKEEREQLQKRFESRLSNLAAFGITAEDLERNDDPDDVRGMSDEAFAEYIRPHEIALMDKQAHEKKVRARVAKIAALGYILLDVNPDAYENHTNSYLTPFPVDLVNGADEAKFEREYNEIKWVYDEKKADEAEELRIAKEAATRQTNRINALAAVGMTFDEKAKAYVGNETSIALSDVTGLEPQSFKDKLDIIRGRYNEALQKAKDAQAKKDDELKKLQDADRKRKAGELEKQENARLANLAPDVDKLRVLYADIKAIKIPELKTTELQVFAKTVEEGLKMITANISKKAREAK